MLVFDLFLTDSRLDKIKSSPIGPTPRSLQRDLEFVSTRGLSDLDSPLNRYEFRQPNRTVDQQEAIKTGGLDIIVIPGKAFTKSGQRMGAWQGWYYPYVRTLKVYKRNLTVVAFAWRHQIVDFIPDFSHPEIKVDALFLISIYLGIPEKSDSPMLPKAPLIRMNTAKASPWDKSVRRHHPLATRLSPASPPRGRPFLFRNVLASIILMRTQLVKYQDITPE
ncbi:unnamed protein product [Bemisia tabaci]|uniref:5-formyltetrahydrofolate cyclo-ligase n=1 Tax=Bemisia tabaci TaxID=7038 RepID=A0A9P0A4K0_BEMTA|nr:unnamed protein product [Bemisia tabaci]